MFRIVVSLIATLAVAATLFPQAQSKRRLSAPTYFIAANAEYRHSQEIWLRGASNLPAGAILVVDVQNYVGEGNKILGVRALPRVGKDGFFEATLTPQAKMEFKHNIVCLVSFDPNYPDQDALVKSTVGQHGERLGFPKNPQAGIGSGDRVYLMSAVHVE